MCEGNAPQTDLPLCSDDLRVCQRIFDIVRIEVGIPPGNSKQDLLAADIIRFYQQGIRNEQQLLILARTSAGS